MRVINFQHIHDPTIPLKYDEIEEFSHEDTPLKQQLVAVARARPERAAKKSLKTPRAALFSQDYGQIGAYNHMHETQCIKTSNVSCTIADTMPRPPNQPPRLEATVTLKGIHRTL